MEEKKNCSWMKLPTILDDVCGRLFSFVVVVVLVDKEFESWMVEEGVQLVLFNR